MRLAFAGLMAVLAICSNFDLARAVLSPAITTTIGVVQGRLVNVGAGGIDVYEFLGIPYAEPPVGKNRFKKPVPKANVQGLYLATKAPNACPQLYGLPIFPQKYVDALLPDQNSAEDCLYVNVWAPRTIIDKLYDSNGIGGALFPWSNVFNAVSSPLAVMIWIHGGGFSSGSSMAPLYNGSALAAYNNVIVVSVQYRLGALGFAYLGTQDVPGNMGLWDQLEAMKWVRNNIAAFGGNADRTTIFGESAGAASVGFHLLSPYSVVYFQRAAMQSGVPTAAAWAHLTKDEALDRTNTLFTILVNSLCPKSITTKSPIDQILNCLRTLNATSYLRYQETVMKADPTGARGLGLGTFLPVIDGDFLPSPPADAMTNKKVANVPVLLGSNREDGSFFMLTSAMARNSLPTPFDMKRVTDDINMDNYTNFIREFFAFYPRPGFPTDDMTRRFIEMQYATSCDGKPLSGDDLVKALVKAVTDFAVACPVWGFGRDHSAVNSNVFMYQFSHRPSMNYWPKWMGVTHSEEVPFVLGFPFTSVGQQSFGYKPEERLLSRRMMTYWTNFAKNGDPNLADAGSPNGMMLPVADWPKYSAGNMTALEIKTTPKQMLNETDLLIPNFKTRDCMFWTDFLPKLYNLVSKQPVG